MIDIAIVGGGPAGLSAAVNAAARGKEAVIFSGPLEKNPLWKSPLVENHVGMPGVSGEEMLAAMARHAESTGVQWIHSRVMGIMNLGESFMINTGDALHEAKAVVLALGAVPAAALSGESELLGRGVSYCATCDGMFYRGKPVVVIGRAADAPEEANYLQGIGCQVTYVAPRVRPAELLEEIPFYAAPRPAILGEDRVTGVQAGGELIPCDGVFILRETIAPARLIDGLEMEGTFIAVDRLMHTNIPGLFAAGDCTGKPLQVSKAVGEGLIAAQEAAKYVDGRGEA